MSQTRVLSLFVVVLFLLFLSSGCATKTLTEPELRQQMFADMRLCVDDIAEADRRSKILTLLNSLEADLEALKARVGQFVAETRALNSNYDATRYDFNKLQARFNASRGELQRRILTAKFEVRSLTTADEWAKLMQIKQSVIQELPNYPES